MRCVQVADAFIVQVAAQKALAQQQQGKLITKSLHAELVYNMSGSRHVSLSFCQHIVLPKPADWMSIPEHSCPADIRKLQQIWGDRNLSASASCTI